MTGAIQRFRTTPESSPGHAARAIEDGWPLSRPLTQRERLAIAIASAGPTNFLTIDSTLDRPAFMQAWRRWIRRMERVPRRRGPLIYVATVAKGAKGLGGHHAHVLLWGYLHLPILEKHCRESGLGKRPQIEQLPDLTHSLQDVLYAVSYVLGQHEPVFNTRHQERHHPLPKGARDLLLPHRSTLEREAPKLLDAVDRARDRSVSDDALVSSCPVFSSKKGPRSPVF